MGHRQAKVMPNQLLWSSSILLVLAAAHALAQFSQLAVIGDGSQLYFTS